MHDDATSCFITLPTIQSKWAHFAGLTPEEQQTTVESLGALSGDPETEAAGRQFYGWLQRLASAIASKDIVAVRSVAQAGLKAQFVFGGEAILSSFLQSAANVLLFWRTIGATRLELSWRLILLSWGAAGEAGDSEWRDAVRRAQEALKPTCSG